MQKQQGKGKKKTYLFVSFSLNPATFWKHQLRHNASKSTFKMKILKSKSTILYKESYLSDMISSQLYAQETLTRLFVKFWIPKYCYYNWQIILMHILGSCTFSSGLSSSSQLSSQTWISGHFYIPNSKSINSPDIPISISIFQNSINKH